ncbi:MAG: hypothetical protein ACHQX1_01595 [Candidatus Micrarchaeales archaeon]
MTNDVYASTINGIGCPISGFLANRSNEGINTLPTKHSSSIKRA